MGEPAGLAKEKLCALARLLAVPGLERWYLAGQSAVAFHLKHRVSRDLDLFADTDGADLDRTRASIVAAIPSVRILGVGDATLRLKLGRVPVDLVAYPYPLLDPAVPGPGGAPIAGLRDLVAMKLSAISRRGIRRDFWDLHVILESGLTIEQAASAYLDKFGLSAPDLYHVARGLTYFDDAERESVPPAGMTDSLWKAVKRHMTRVAPMLLISP